MPDVIGGRYELQAELGRGGMGIVYRARDRQTGGTVAVKVLNPGLNNNARLLNRFLNEVQISQRLVSPNVVRVLDSGRDNDYVYLVMECIEGADLRTLIRENAPCDPGEAKRVIQGVIGALMEAHPLGIVHRDITPQNILIGDDGVVKLTDFGIARAHDMTAMT